MREILKQELGGGDRVLVVMRTREDKDPVFYYYYNWIDETEVQKTTYTLDHEQIEYYTGDE